MNAYPFKALSLSRPWPNAILQLGKRIENRSRSDGAMPDICRHRGPLLLHAAKSRDAKAFRQFMRDVFHSVAYPKDPEVPAGVIFARCNVVGHIESSWYGGKPIARVVLAAAAYSRINSAIGHYDGHYEDRLILTPHVPDDEYAAMVALVEYAKALDLRWWMGGYGLVLANVEPTNWVACKGALGIWKVPDGVVADLGM